ncbi:MAG: squalene/phytoene synthase family protein [Mariniblastus sp.]|nr:squalene/phytoene synthase family protein [Mariniblastus sp.]
MLETREHIELNTSAIDRGHKSIRGAVKKCFKSHIWTINNMPSGRRRGIEAVLFNLMKTIDLLDLDSVDGLSLDVWHETRDDLSDAFQDNCTSVELAALVDTARKFNIPKQYLFDPYRGADFWIRNREFQTFDELEVFCSNVGGASLAATMPVLGVTRKGWDVQAIKCGKAIMLTQILANAVNDFKQNKVFFALEDIEDCKVDIPRLKLRRESKSFRFLIRLYASRIEKLFYECADLASFLDFDGQRSLKSLLGRFWKTLLKMKIEPECILSEEGVLSSRDLLSLKSRHLMGMEKKIPIVHEQQSHH